MKILVISLNKAIFKKLKMKFLRFTSFLWFTGILSSFAQQNSILQSPDGKMSVTVSKSQDDFSPVTYSIHFNGKQVILPSGLGFKLAGRMKIGNNLRLVLSGMSEIRQEWMPVFGERSKVQDNYNQTEIRLEDENNDPKLLMTFRAYNEGVAFCYTFSESAGSDSLIIADELTEFRFAADYPAWVATRAQAQYRKIPIGEIAEAAERPLLVETGDSMFLAIGEARQVDFPRMKFKASPEKENTLKAELDGEARIGLPYTTPWRYVMTASTPGELLENNYFILNLNDPCILSDVSWIKPGKVIREVTLTTQGGKACVDFAVENGLQYVEFDAGWYGPENNDLSDATTVTVDPARSPGPLDLKEIINYAEQKDIGVLVYVNRRALENQLDEILPLYKSWGIKGVKYGFVQVGSLKWTTWLHEAVKKAADNQLMVDIHDEYRPTGFSRTYPNLMTQEGIRGDEESPSNEHTLITLFTRMIAGAGDNTICYYAPRVTEKMGGHVSQLAKAVMLYSPWQFLYWYDRPQGSPGKKGGAGNSEGYIRNDPELEFFKKLPVVWDETRVLEGKTGEYATIARKSGNNWFLGSLTGRNQSTISIPLTFLDSDASYEATIYSYDPSFESSTKLKIESVLVNAGFVLRYNINSNSGLAAIFLKK